MEEQNLLLHLLFCHVKNVSWQSRICCSIFTYCHVAMCAFTLLSLLIYSAPPCHKFDTQYCWIPSNAKKSFCKSRITVQLTSLHIEFTQQKMNLVLIFLFLGNGICWIFALICILFISQAIQCKEVVDVSQRVKASSSCIVIQWELESASKFIRRTFIYFNTKDIRVNPKAISCQIEHLCIRGHNLSPLLVVFIDQIYDYIEYFYCFSGT